MTPHLDQNAFDAVAAIAVAERRKITAQEYRDCFRRGGKPVLGAKSLRTRRGKGVGPVSPASLPEDYDQLLDLSGQPRGVEHSLDAQMVLEQAREWTLAARQHDRVLKSGELVEAVALPRGRVFAAIKELAASGYLINTGKGLWMARRVNLHDFDKSAYRTAKRAKSRRIV